MTKIYLTIDDSPSPRTDDLCDYLVKHHIPALFFCRGDFLEENRKPVIRAIEQGLDIGAHGYFHRRAGDMSFDEVCESISRCDSLIEDCYKQARTPRPGKYFRFPYIDRGDGDPLERRFFGLIEMAQRGKEPDIADHENVTRLQDYLDKEGFTQPFENILHPLYSVPKIRDAKDCLFTYSTADWMLTARHKGKHPLSSIEDLKQKMDDDPWLFKGPGAQIALIHDADEIFDVSRSLVNHMLARGVSFKRIKI